MECYLFKPKEAGIFIHGNINGAFRSVASYFKFQERKTEEESQRTILTEFKQKQTCYPYLVLLKLQILLRSVGYLY